MVRLGCAASSSLSELESSDSEEMGEGAEMVSPVSVRNCSGFRKVQDTLMLPERGLSCWPPLALQVSEEQLVMTLLVAVGESSLLLSSSSSSGMTI